MKAKDQKVYQICTFIRQGELNDGRDGLNNVSLLFTGKAYPTVKNLLIQCVEWHISLIIMLCFENTQKSGLKSVHCPTLACLPTQLQ